MNYTIYIIGAGKVGTSLLRVLNRNPFHVSCITDSKPSKAAFVRKRIPAVSCSTFLNRNLLLASNVVLITVNDDQIVPVVKALLNYTLPWNGKIVLHTSGLYNSQVLDKLHNCGAETGSFHPMQTFQQGFLPPGIFKNIYFTFEGSAAAEKFCRTVSRTVHARFLKIRAEMKGIYHLGGVVTANFLVALLYFSQHLFRKTGFKKAQIDSLLKTLIDTTLHNFNREGAKKILTGPLQRGDILTIHRHLEILKSQVPDYVDLYAGVSKFITQNLVDLEQNKRTKIIKLLHT